MERLNVNSKNVQGSESVLLALDTNILIKAESENILNRKVKRIMKELQTWFHAKGLLINTEAISCHTW